MNYINSRMDNQLKNEELVPELPPFGKVPKTMELYPNWVSWDYVVRQGCISYVQTWPDPGDLKSTLERCKERNQGLGYKLSKDDPFSVVIISKCFDEHGKITADAEDMIRIASTYTEIDDHMEEIYIVAYTDTDWDISKGNVKIVSDRDVIPIACHTRSLFPDVKPRTDEFARIASRYCAINWMEKVRELDGQGDEFSILMRVLTECLAIPGWFENAENTSLYPFLAYCWSYQRLIALVRNQIDNDIKNWQSRELKWKTLVKIIEETRIEIGLDKPRVRGVGDKHEEAQEFDDDLPTIEHDRSYPTKSTDETIDALIEFDAPIWQRDGALVTIQSASRDPSSPNPSERKKIRIISLDPDYLQELATQAAHHLVDYRIQKGKTFYRYDTCPMNTVKRIIARPNHDPFPHLSGIVTIPTLRRDGSIITEPGYDPSTALYYKPSREFPEPKKNPTRDDAIAALESLQEPMADFTFPMDCFKSSAIAAILTVMSRHILQNVPATPISSSTRGIGKGLLFSIITIIGTGEKIAPSPYPKNEEEMAKQFLSIGMEGARIVLFDNITRPFGGETLELSLTSDFFKSRILSTNTMSEIKMGTTFFATGNNMRFSGDTLRRSIPIIIESKVESPEERSDFKIKRLKEWLMENQPRLAMDALTILQAYMQAGQPSMNLTEYGSFEEWSDLVRSALVWLEMDDPCLAQKELQQQSDPGYEQLKTLIEAWDVAYPNREPVNLKNVILRVKSEYDLYLKQNPTAKASMVDLGLALTAYDIPSNGNIAALNFNRLFQKMPINNGRSRIIFGKWMASKDGGKDKGRLYYIDGDKDTKSDSDDSALSYSPDENSDLPF